MASCHCNTDPPAQDNWLITQHIIRDGDVPQVSVQVEFELTGCEAGCQVSFLLEVWETSTIDRTQARNTSNYRRVQRVAPNQDSGLVSQNSSIPVDFNTNETGFYLAFVDDNTCIAITRIIVFYYVCPAMVLDLVIYPEILSPPIDNLGSQSKTVTGRCVNGSLGESGRNPSLQCIQAGKWGALQEGTGCHCNPGFVAVEDVEECASESILGQVKFEANYSVSLLQHVVLVSMCRHPMALVSHALQTLKFSWWVCQYASV